MKTAIHRRLDKFCSRRVMAGKTYGFMFRLASRLEALLRGGKSTWRYGIRQALEIALQDIEPRPERKKVPKLLRRIRTMNGDFSGRYR